MKIRYYPKMDSLRITLSSGSGAETRQIAHGISVDLDKDCNVVGLDIDHASRLDLATLDIDVNNQRVALATKIS